MRIAEVRPFPSTRILAITVLAFLIPATAGAQQASQASSSSFTGCVQGSYGEPFVLTAPNFCAILKGKVADELIGHQIQVTGVLAPATKASPATIQVASVSSVGDACTETCAARPQPRAEPTKVLRSKRRPSNSPMH